MTAKGYASLTDPTPFKPKGEHEGIESLKRWGEADTVTCGHCQSLIHVPVGRIHEVVGGCRICERMICPKCVNKGTCAPWEEAFARMAAREDARRSYGL